MKKATRFEILCFGDSMLKFGIAPRVLEAKLGRKVYNLALLDGKPVLTYLLFRRAIEAGARPSALIVNFAPEGLNQPPWHLLTNPHWNALLASPREAWELARTYHDREFFGHLVVARVLPSFRCRGQIRADVLAAFQGQSGPNPETQPAAAAELAGQRRRHPPGQAARLPGRRPAPVGRRPVQRRLRGPAGERPLRAPAAPAGGRAQHRRLLAADRPTRPVVIAARDGNGVHAKYDRFVRGLQMQFPNLSVIDARHAGYHELGFRRSGPPRSRWGRRAQQRRGQGAGERSEPSEPVARWVELPAYRDQVATVRLEDVRPIAQGTRSLRRDPAAVM